MRRTIRTHEGCPGWAEELENEWTLGKLSDSSQYRFRVFTASLVSSLGFDSVLLEISHRAMACDFVVLIRDEEQRIGHRSVADVVVKALEGVDLIERRLTVYQPSSEISAINRAAGGEGAIVSAATFGLLQHAAALSAATGGAFDVTAGPLVDAWGFTDRQGKKPNREQLEAARGLVGYERMRLDAATRRVVLTRPGMRINLGGIGKGDAIDAVAKKLKDAGIEHFLIHAGHSSVMACGDQFPREAVEGPSAAGPTQSDASRVPPTGWLVGIAHPTKPKRRLAGIWLCNAALSTSGSGKQFFHYRGKRYGHVIDPRTGHPAGDLLSITLVCDRAVDADALATGLFVMGREAAIEFASTAANRVVREREMPLILVAGAERQDEVRIETRGDWNWAEPPKDG